MSNGNPKSCPKCHADLEGEEVYQVMRRQYDTEKKALEVAGHYGWTKEKPVRFSRVIGISDMDKDCVVRWRCPDCDHEWERKGWQKYAIQTEIADDE